LRQDAARAEREAFEEEWNSRWAAERARLSGLQDRIHHLESRLLPVAESMLESAFQGYVSGRSGFLDLMDAERSAHELRLQLVELHSQLEMTNWTLLYLAGRFDTTDTAIESR